MFFFNTIGIYKHIIVIVIKIFIYVLVYKNLSISL